MEYLDAPVFDQRAGLQCRMSHEAAVKLLGGPVNVLLYDCTTLAFDTEREDDHAVEVPDRLLVKNFNKDGRHFRSQIAGKGVKNSGFSISRMRIALFRLS